MVTSLINLLKPEEGVMTHEHATKCLLTIAGERPFTIVFEFHPPASLHRAILQGSVYGHQGVSEESMEVTRGQWRVTRGSVEGHQGISGGSYGVSGGSKGVS